MGEKKAVVKTAFRPQAMYVDIKTKYTGSWMKRFFGKVTEARQTTHFLLDSRQIREVNWHRGNIRVFPLDQVSDVDWVSGKTSRTAQAEEMISQRYTSRPPQFTITATGVSSVINGIKAERIDTTLRLETYDKKKNASSVTNIQQELWVARGQAQHQDYHAFFKALASQLGVDAERLKSMSPVLQYWEGSLDPIRDKLRTVGGFPVRSELSVEAVYIKNVGTPQSETIRKKVKTETLTLQSIQIAALNPDDFSYPEGFPLVYTQ
jgi:hypothetical protein